MPKKIIFIFVSAILLIADISIKSNYNYDSTKIVIRDTYTVEDIIKKHVSNEFAAINKRQYNESYNKINGGVFKDQYEFEELMNKNFTDQGNLVSVDEINKLERNIYEVKVRVEPPLFTPYEKMNLEQYKQKYFNLKIQLKGLFDYRILEFEKVE